MNKLTYFAYSRWYWGGLLLLTLGLEATALFYQYYLEEPPCVLCIQVRIWVLTLFIVALYGFFLNCCRWSCAMAHFLTLGISIALLNRAWHLYQIENGGGGIGSCTMELGLPSWFALDKWFPAFFEVQTTCGYTPEIFFTITMAESLLALFVVLLIVSTTLFLITILNKK